MKSKQDILNRIYKACFLYPNLKDTFFNDWGYIANLLADGDEDIPLELLACVNLWLDENFDLDF